MLQKRLSYVDVAKGVAMWLMIFGHQYISERTYIYLYSFHMPLFFFISGMFFRKNKPFFQNLESAVRGLLVPYLFFSVLSLSICWISPYIHPELYYDMKGADVFRAAVNGIFIGADRVTPKSFLPAGPLWFLVALFVIKVFCSATALVLKNKYVWGLVTVAMSIALYFVITTPVYSLRDSMMAVPFFVVGFLLREFDFMNLRFKPMILLCLIAYFLIMVPRNGWCSSDGGVYGNWMILYYVNALVGTLIVLIFSTYVSDRDSYIEEIGRNTIAILGTHAFFATPIKVIMVYLFGNEVMHTLPYIIIVPVVVIILSVMAARPIKRYVPFAVGKRGTGLMPVKAGKVAGM